MTEGADMDRLSRDVLDRIQGDFPLVADPYAAIAGDLGTTREAVHEVVLRQRHSGVIRRLGASFASGPLGYVSSLVAARVAPDDLEHAAAGAGAFPEVTHNYERQGIYNLWFTVIAEGQERLEAILATVREQPGVAALHSLPALQTFKIRVQFSFGAEGPASPASPTPARSQATDLVELDRTDRRIIARVCDDLGEAMEPFAAVAAELQVPTDLLLQRLRYYQEHGAMRRFGAILRHQRAGFTANGMSVWRVDRDDVERVGRELAATPSISHCYERPSMPDWPYNVYGMIHARSREQCLNIAAELAERTGIDDYRVLFSLREFKKTSMRYLV